MMKVAIAFLIFAATIYRAMAYGWNWNPPKPEPHGKSGDFA